jgi:hypothetical protein
VFFDELGPPWPKHPCTDNAALTVQQLFDAPSKSTPLWRKDGWDPIVIRSSRLDRNWHLIPVENVITRLHFDVLADTPLRLQGETCAFMKAWNSDGWSVISFVELDGCVEEIVVPIFEKKRYFHASRTAATAQRKRSVRV